MFEARPVKDTVKLPVPVPLLVFVLNETVGFGLVDQTTPLAVTAAPPSDVTLPPEAAVVDVIALTAVVIRMGDPIVLKDTSFP